MQEPLWKSRPTEIYHATLGVQKINDFIYLSEGLSNCFLLTLPDERIVVNTGMGVEAPIHKHNFDSISRARTSYIICTQGHVDHVGGNDLFRESGTEVVASAAIAESQEFNRHLNQFKRANARFAFTDIMARTEAYVTEHAAGPVPQAVCEPTIEVVDQLEITPGGLRMQLMFLPGAETNDSLIIWLPEQKICFAGNLFGAFFGHFPNLGTIRGDRYRPPLAVIRAFQTVLALEPELLLVGHHQPIAGAALIHTEVKRLLDALVYVHDATVAGMTAGRTVWELMAAIKLPPQLDVGEAYGSVSWAVRAIREYYGGWFHQQSTTELYPVRPEAVHTDILAATGGPQPLLERARSRLAAGQPLEALHLTDILLSGEQPDARAVDIAVAAHELLLQRPEAANFWLSAWLQQRLRELRNISLI